MFRFAYLRQSGQITVTMQSAIRLIKISRRSSRENLRIGAICFFGGLGLGREYRSYSRVRSLDYRRSQFLLVLFFELTSAKYDNQSESFFQMWLVFFMIVFGNYTDCSVPIGVIGKHYCCLICYSIDYSSEFIKKYDLAYNLAYYDQIPYRNRCFLVQIPHPIQRNFYRKGIYLEFNECVCWIIDISGGDLIHGVHFKQLLSNHMIVAQQQSCCFSSFFRASSHSRPPPPALQTQKLPALSPTLSHSPSPQPYPSGNHTQPTFNPSICLTNASKNPPQTASSSTQHAKPTRQITFKLDYSQESRSVGQQNRVMTICEIESHFEEKSQSDNKQKGVVIEQSFVVHDYFDSQGRLPPSRPPRSHKVKRLYRHKPPN